jgi:Flp pilus assembly protein TadD
MNMMHGVSRVAVLAGLVLCSACAADPGSAAIPAGPYGAYLAARYADAAQDPATAAHFYTQALAADPQNLTLLQQDFVASMLAGDPDAADLAGRIQGNTLAVMLRGNQAVQEQNYAQAAQDFAELPPDDLPGLIKPLLLAWVNYGGGDAPAALASLGPKFSNPAFGPIYVLNAALIADASGDTKDAAKLYAAVADDTPNLRLAQILASWQTRQGNRAAAQAEWQALASAHPDLALAVPALQGEGQNRVISTPAQGLAETYLTLAGSLNQPQQILLKISFLRFALALRPDLTAARLLLAATLAGENLPQGAPPPRPAALQTALAVLQPIGTDDPLYIPAMLQKASLLSAMNHPAEAAELLAHLVALQPGNPDLLEAAGDALRGNNQYQAAIADYTQAIAALHGATPPGAWTLYFDRGICEDQLGNAQAAEPDLLQARALAPNQPYVLNYIAYSWAVQGVHLAEAQAMLQQAVGLDPNDGAVIDSLGYVELRQHKTRQAMALLIKAVQLAPQDAEVNAHLGDAFAQGGQKLQAVYQWSRALGLKPDAKLKATLLNDIAG